MLNGSFVLTKCEKENGKWITDNEKFENKYYPLSIFRYPLM